MSSFKGEKFVLFPRWWDPSLYALLTGFCPAARFVPNVVQEATQWQSIVSLVEAGMGVSLAPGSIRKLRCRGIVYRELPHLHTVVRACWLMDDPSPAVNAF